VCHKIKAPYLFGNQVEKITSHCDQYGNPDAREPRTLTDYIRDSLSFRKVDPSTTSPDLHRRVELANRKLPPDSRNAPAVGERRGSLFLVELTVGEGGSSHAGFVGNFEKLFPKRVSCLAGFPPRSASGFTFYSEG
jgi:hypothetical protein